MTVERRQGNASPRRATEGVVFYYQHREDDPSAYEIDRECRKQGAFHCGYHFVITKNGIVQHGRSIDEVGLHSRRRYINENYVGVLVITDDDAHNMDDEQTHACDFLVLRLEEQYGNKKKGWMVTMHENLN